MLLSLFSRAFTRVAKDIASVSFALQNRQIGHNTVFSSEKGGAAQTKRDSNAFVSFGMGSQAARALAWC
jgi:hypothetical protein